MRVFYCDEFVLPLPDAHRFPMAKYRLLRERLCARGSVASTGLRVPEPASDAQLLAVHERSYVVAVVSGEIPAAAIRRLGFPWSPQLVERSRRSVGGTIGAARAALADGVGVNLAGGTHHAFADRGEGYCVFNDAAVAVRAMQGEGRIRRAAIVDCDVHQGNGTAAIFAADPTVATFSIHARRNFPFHKERSDLDVALEDGADDRRYLDALAASLPRFLTGAAPELVVYVSGADPWHGDRLGRLALSKEGLARRDRLVLDACAARRIPVAVVMAGGYAPDVCDIVDIHVATVEEALRPGRRHAADGIMNRPLQTHESRRETP